jgi:hypothetical protein
MKQARGFLKDMAAESQVVALPEFADLDTGARVTTLDFAAAGVRLSPSQHALAAAAAAVARLGLLPAPALDEAVGLGGPEHTESERKAIAAGRAAAGDIGLGAKAPG